MGRPHTGRADKRGSAGGNGEERIAARSARHTGGLNPLHQWSLRVDLVVRPPLKGHLCEFVSTPRERQGLSCSLGSRHLARALPPKEERGRWRQGRGACSLRDFWCVFPGCYRIFHKCATSLASSCRDSERTANLNRRGAPEDLSTNLLLHSASCDESASSSQRETRNNRRCARCGSSKEWSYAPTSSMGRRTCVCTRCVAHAVCACRLDSVIWQGRTLVPRRF